MRIGIINGPNLNLLGQREPEIYGHKKFEDYLVELKERNPEVNISYYQSNVEGELINYLQESARSNAGLILNAAGFSHTSIALADTVAAVHVPVVEVHISNIHAREAFRIHTYTGAAAAGVITGFGLQGYQMAIDYLIRTINPS
jgi:3-dehydroquinate dehydratase-2